MKEKFDHSVSSGKVNSKWNLLIPVGMMIFVLLARMLFVYWISICETSAVNSTSVTSPTANLQIISAEAAEILNWQENEDDSTNGDDNDDDCLSVDGSYAPQGHLDYIHHKYIRNVHVVRSIYLIVLNMRI